MRRGTKFLILLVIVIGLLAAGAASILHDGLSARAQPSALETALAAVMRKLAMPSAAHSAKNPVANSPEVLRDGRLHFADHCAICHGNDGSGDTEMGRGLYPRAPDMRLAATQNLTDGELFYIIENGVKLTGMPAWGGEGHEGDSSWKLVRFIRHLPKVSEAEIEHMKQLNPKGPDEWKEQQDAKQFLEAEKPPAKPAHKHGGK